LREATDQLILARRRELQRRLTFKRPIGAWREVVAMTTELPGAQQEEFSLRVAFYRRGAVVIETRGVARRKTAGLLARVIRALARPGGVLVVDLSEHLDADYWLVSAVAKAHAAAHASRAGLHVVVGCRPVLESLHSSGLDRLVAVTRRRDFDDGPGSAVEAGQTRTADRQRVIDLSSHGTADRGRGLAAGRARWSGPPGNRS
ncbi:MAG TPA: hypothetical protein VFN80_03525, partial [Acidothermaceae bacterium]|nr:hypothetical protein [Acidothermaceae bacterium]